MSRPSAMDAEELRIILQDVWGDRGQRRAALDLGRKEVTISRWLNGHTPVEETEATLLRLIYVCHLRRMPWRPLLVEYNRNRKLDKLFEGLKL